MSDGLRPPSGAREVDAAALARDLRRAGLAHGAPWLHAEVARRMAERLAVVRRTPASVVDWWSFLGGGQALLARAYPRARLLCIEPTDELQQRVRASLAVPWWSARRWAPSRVEVLAPESLGPEAAQLVWANMMLHRLADPLGQLQQWRQLLAVDGFLMFSTLGPGSLQGLRSLYRRVGWPAPFAPFVDMHDLGDMLLRSGFADPVMDQETLILTWTDAPGLLQELRALGGNAAVQRFAGLRTPRWHRRLLDELRALAGPDGRLRLDFEVVYGHAFKAAPKPSVAAQTQIALDDMRRMVRAPRRDR